METLTRNVLDRDGHRCRGLVAGGERCPETRDLVMHQLDPGPLVLATSARVIALCRHHHEEATR